MNSNFKLNRQVVTKSSFEEADNHVSFYADKTPHERLQHACFIINQIFTEEQRKVKRNITYSRKHDNIK
jgi:hypothetical protein